MNALKAASRINLISRSNGLIRNAQQAFVNTNLTQRSFGTSARLYFSSSKAFLSNSTNHRIIILVGAVIGGSCGLALLYHGDLNGHNAASEKKKLVILGTGWGTVSLLRNLDPDEYDVSVVSPQNYFLFTPLLPSVTVGTIEARSIVEPIRKLVGKKKRDKIKFYEAECTDVLLEEKQIHCKDSSAIVGAKDKFTLDYDMLVVAVGAKTNTYGIPGIKEHTHYLKEIDDAQKIRKNVMDSFETAAIPGQPKEEIDRLLHFVVVGGGPTGVEFIAELRDFVTHDLSKLYPELNRRVKLTLIDGYNKILNTYDEEISRYTEARFKADHINVVKSTFVTGIDDTHVTIMDAKSKEKNTIPYGMCVWAAGIAPQDLTTQLIHKIPEQTNRNAVQTNGYLQVKNAEGVFALGDCSTVEVQLMAPKLDEMFKEADKDNDGVLNIDEFKGIMQEAQKRFPQATLFFSKAIDLESEKSTKGFFSKADKNQSNSLTIDEFRSVLQEVDQGTNMLPATAQVAAQQGKYLGKIFSKNSSYFNETKGSDFNLQSNNMLPFDYHYLGSFAYVGENRAVLQLPVLGSFKGLATMWLWRAAYTSDCMTLRMKMLVIFDWMKSAVFGRDTSRI